MQSQPKSPGQPPRVAFVGDAEHRDFRATTELVRTTAHMLSETELATADLLLLAQSRPGTIANIDLQRLTRLAPLAGMVALLGTWCEGETRTGRPLADVRRVYWYDFPMWWRRQIASWCIGRCPDWARPPDDAAPTHDSTGGGIVVVHASCWETAEILAELLRDAGYAPYLVGHKDCPNPRIPQSAVAAIWEGRQLDDREAVSLGGFCQRSRSRDIPVLVLLDFPRGDRCELADKVGAAVVVAKPWQNALLLDSLKLAAESKALKNRLPRAA